jgi:type IV secretory pathway VirB10-like protein
VFVNEGHFLDPVRPGATVIVNQTIINKTVNITKVQVVNNTVVNGGPQAEEIARATGRPVQPVSVRQVRHQEETSVVKKQPALQKLRPVHKPKATLPGQDQQREAAQPGQGQQHEATAQENGGRQESVEKQPAGEGQSEEKAQQNREKKPAAKKKKKKKVQEPGGPGGQGQGEEER